MALQPQNENFMEEDTNQLAHSPRPNPGEVLIPPPTKRFKASKEPFKMKVVDKNILATADQKTAKQIQRLVTDKEAYAKTIAQYMLDENDMNVHNAIGKITDLTLLKRKLQENPNSFLQTRLNSALAQIQRQALHLARNPDGDTFRSKSLSQNQNNPLVNQNNNQHNFEQGFQQPAPQQLPPDEFKNLDDNTDPFANQSRSVPTDLSYPSDLNANTVNDINNQIQQQDEYNAQLYDYDDYLNNANQSQLPVDSDNGDDEEKQIEYVTPQHDLKTGNNNVPVTIHVNNILPSGTPKNSMPTNTKGMDIEETPPLINNNLVTPSPAPPPILQGPPHQAVLNNNQDQNQNLNTGVASTNNNTSAQVPLNNQTIPLTAATQQTFPPPTIIPSDNDNAMEVDIKPNRIEYEQGNPQRILIDTVKDFHQKSFFDPNQYSADKSLINSLNNTVGINVAFQRLQDLFPKLVEKARNAYGYLNHWNKQNGVPFQISIPDNVKAYLNGSMQNLGDVNSIRNACNLLETFAQDVVTYTDNLSDNANSFISKHEDFPITFSSVPSLDPKLRRTEIQNLVYAAASFGNHLVTTDKKIDQAAVSLTSKFAFPTDTDFSQYDPSVLRLWENSLAHANDATKKLYNTEIRPYLKYLGNYNNGNLLYELVQNSNNPTTQKDILTNAQRNIQGNIKASTDSLANKLQLALYDLTPEDQAKVKDKLPEFSLTELYQSGSPPTSKLLERQQAVRSLLQYAEAEKQKQSQSLENISLKQQQLAKLTSDAKVEDQKELQGLSNFNLGTKEKVLETDLKNALDIANEFDKKYERYVNSYNEFSKEIQDNYTNLYNHPDFSKLTKFQRDFGPHSYYNKLHNDFDGRKVDMSKQLATDSSNIEILKNDISNMLEKVKADDLNQLRNIKQKLEKEIIELDPNQEAVIASSKNKLSIAKDDMERLTKLKQELTVGLTKKLQTITELQSKQVEKGYPLNPVYWNEEKSSGPNIPEVDKEIAAIQNQMLINNSNELGTEKQMYENTILNLQDKISKFTEIAKTTKEENLKKLSLPELKEKAKLVSEEFENLQNKQFTLQSKILNDADAIKITRSMMHSNNFDTDINTLPTYRTLSTTPYTLKLLQYQADRIETIRKKVEETFYNEKTKAEAQREQQKIDEVERHNREMNDYQKDKLRRDEQHKEQMLEIEMAKVHNNSIYKNRVADDRKKFEEDRRKYQEEAETRDRALKRELASQHETHEKLLQTERLKNVTDLVTAKNKLKEDDKNLQRANLKSVADGMIHTLRHRNIDPIISSDAITSVEDGKNAVTLLQNQLNQADVFEARRNRLLKSIRIFQEENGGKDDDLPTMEEIKTARSNTALTNLQEQVDRIARNSKRVKDFREHDEEYSYQQLKYKNELAKLTGDHTHLNGDSRIYLDPTEASRHLHTLKETLNRFQHEQYDLKRKRENLLKSIKQEYSELDPETRKSLPKVEKVFAEQGEDLTDGQLNIEDLRRQIDLLNNFKQTTQQSIQYYSEARESADQYDLAQDEFANLVRDPSLIYSALKLGNTGLIDEKQKEKIANDATHLKNLAKDIFEHGASFLAINPTQTSASTLHSMFEDAAKISDQYFSDESIRKLKWDQIHDDIKNENQLRSSARLEDLAHNKQEAQVYLLSLGLDFLEKKLNPEEESMSKLVVALKRVGANPDIEKILHFSKQEQLTYLLSQIPNHYVPAIHDYPLIKKSLQEENDERYYKQFEADRNKHRASYLPNERENIVPVSTDLYKGRQRFEKLRQPGVNTLHKLDWNTGKILPHKGPIKANSLYLFNEPKPSKRLSKYKKDNLIANENKNLPAAIRFGRDKNRSRANTYSKSLPQHNLSGLVKLLGIVSQSQKKREIQGLNKKPKHKHTQAKRKKIKRKQKEIKNKIKNLSPSSKQKLLQTEKDKMKKFI